jgi:CubicO group peptidase (beta-lactamase class C family)
MTSVHAPDTLPGRSPGEGYGLSMRVVNDRVKRGVLASDGSFGWSGIYGTHYFVDPKEKVVGVLMVQVTGLSLPESIEIADDFENMVMQAIVE